MSSKKYDEHDLQDIAERAAGAVEKSIKSELRLVLVKLEIASSNA